MAVFSGLWCSWHAVATGNLMLYRAYAVQRELLPISAPFLKVTGKEG